MQTLLDDLNERLLAYYDQFVNVLPKLIIAIVVFTIILFIANYASRKTNTRLTKRLEDPLLAKFIGRIIKITLVVIGLLIVLQIIGLGGTAAGLLGTAGMGAFVFGFAFKDIGEHFLAGIMLAFNRPFNVGDVVELDDQKGVVVTLNLRNTHIKTFDGKDIYIPNGNVIKNPLINYTIDGFLRNSIEFGIDYDDDVQKAIQIIHNVLANTEGVLQDNKKPSVHISSLGTSTLNLEIYYWIDTFDSKVPSLVLKTNLIKDILKSLNESGFYLPGEVVELKNYKKDSLRSAVAS